MDEIVNRVANSKLLTVDLEDLYQEGARVMLDIAQWLEEGFLLREKPFRESVANHSWQDYKDSFVVLHCSTDAIIPAWAYMLVSTHLQGIAKKTVIGTTKQLELVLYTEAIQQLDCTLYQDAPVIIKGCADKPVPEQAYLLLIEKLQPIARSLLFGEACSSVPLYKRKRVK